MELNAISEREQAEPVLYYDCHCTDSTATSFMTGIASQVTESTARSPAHLCKVINASWFPFFELNLIDLKLVLSWLGWSISIWSCSVVLHLCLNWVQTDWRQLDISIRAKGFRDYQKRAFQSFSSTSPLSSFAYKHSPKYPHKRWMSLCSCILPFIGWETMHQSVRLPSLIHTAHEKAVMPQENVYW